MTALTLPAPRQLPVPVVLGLQEGRRIALHPVALTGLSLNVVTYVAITDNGPRDAFELLSTGPTWFFGVFTYFAAHLVASRDRRAHSGELLAPSPSPEAVRTAALCLGALVPALVCTAFVVVGHLLNLARDLYVVTPSVWHLAQAPLSVLGGALLGIMVARLSAVPGVALLVMVAMVAWNVWVSNRPDDLAPLGTYVSWAAWGPGTDWAGLQPGSPAWHDVYLAALCAMAATGAFLRDATRKLPVLALGSVLTALAVAAGAAALP